MSDSQCCENPPNLTSICGGGSVIEVGGLKAYVAGPSDSKHAILLVSDIFGHVRGFQGLGIDPVTEYTSRYEAPKFRKLADKVAAAGFYVVVPDFFYGDPFVFDIPEKPIEVWRESHGTDKGFEDAKPVIAALKSKGISTIGAAGFCWGAKVVVELAKSDYIQSAVLLHPSRVTVDDIKEVKAPIAVLGAEIDKASPPELLKQFEEVLSTKPEVNSYVKIFPGVVHGWSVRYKDENEIEVKSAEEAHQNMVDWFTRYVK
ncbi:Endo-1,3;1,4-beta-D-glucanase [Vitis vinifera]|uniref:Endo-1,31,4-beta-D-glucanase n=1 Tax=Vitis vinifera TaxID=29760 RepID=A0A438KHJ5_VITVI|nr:Endo-1,3;1,4-beta-D-glucanase [Vitis vinifera]